MLDCIKDCSLIVLLIGNIWNSYLVEKKSSAPTRTSDGVNGRVQDSWLL